MALSTRLDLRQSQSLVMTPQLQQAIKLLQLSNIELTAYVEEQIEQNPLLERADRADDLDGDTGESGRTDAGETGSDAAASGADEARELGGDGARMDEDFGQQGGDGVLQDNLWNGDGDNRDASSTRIEDSMLSVGSWSGTGGSHDFEDGGYESQVTEKISLRQHLAEQLNCDLADPIDRMIGLELIEVLDEAGYLAGDLADIAEKLGCTEARVETVLAAMQRFDPPGIFARDLAECLALQLKERDRFDPAMAKLIANLDLVARRDVKTLMRKCGVDGEDLIDMIGEIKSLDPKPALAFDRTTADLVTPDILMRARPEGGWHIELNPDTLPRVLVNNRYYTQISRGGGDKDTKQYLQESYQAANWLVKALHQRARTILRVAEEIVRQQEQFFAKGVEYLRPLVLRDIAEKIDMHESTVSRVTNNKFIETPRGLFELKYFFTTAIPSADGAPAHSAEAIRHRIKIMIEGEKPDDILSDDRVVAILRDDGIDIARRTVAKYREALNIPSSLARRREKMVEI